VFPRAQPYGLQQWSPNWGVTCDSSGGNTEANYHVILYYEQSLRTIEGNKT